MKTSALAALVLLHLTVNGQSVSSSVVNSSGNSFSQGYYTIEWSIGELALVNTLKSPDGLLLITSGFLQPELPQNNLYHHFTADELKILPNPTFNQVELNFSTRQQGVLRIHVYDASGKMIRSSQASSNGTGNIERVDLSSSASGTYLIRVDLDPAPGSVRKTGSYKIIKL